MEETKEMTRESESVNTVQNAIPVQNEIQNEIQNGICPICKGLGKIHNEANSHIPKKGTKVCEWCEDCPACNGIGIKKAKTCWNFLGYSETPHAYLPIFFGCYGCSLGFHICNKEKKGCCCSYSRYELSEEITDNICYF